MTELRDARLRKAMEEAPDATLRPPAGTRDAIRAAAHAAVEPAWRRWWPASGPGRTPWLAAFASLLVATLVVLVWHGQEVPGARKEAPLADQQVPGLSAPAEAPRPEASAPAASASSPTTASEQAPQQQQPTPVPATSDKAAVRERSVREQAASRDLERDQDSRAAERRAEQERRAAERNGEQNQVAAKRSAERQQDQALQPGVRGEAGQSPVAQAPAAAEPTAPAAAPQPAPAPAPVMPQAAAIAPTPAPAAAPSTIAPASPAMHLRASAALPWDAVRIEANGRSVRLARADAGALGSPLERLLNSVQSEDVGASPASLRMELTQGGQVLGVLELGLEGWRWRSAGGTMRTLRADPQVAEQVREEALRALGR
jgi:hypothetical protein